MDTNSTSLIIDLRERMVRIETKLDTQADKFESLTKVSDNHAARLTTIETEATQLRGTVRTLKWVGGLGVTVLTVFGDRILQILT